MFRTPLIVASVLLGACSPAIAGDSNLITLTGHQPERQRSSLRLHSVQMPTAVGKRLPAHMETGPTAVHIPLNYVVPSLRVGFPDLADTVTPPPFTYGGRAWDNVERDLPFDDLIRLPLEENSHVDDELKQLFRLVAEETLEVLPHDISPRPHVVTDIMR
ncbi:MAG: hypothetical protein KDA60_07770 [Planctomycetales bacterium]|nr:hypothetical protein [Planctomycetales bacterium]